MTCVLFRAERLIVELDGWEYHGTREAFEDDRERDTDTLAAGFQTIRITWERLRDDPVKEADRLRAILSARRTDGARPRGARGEDCRAWVGFWSQTQGGGGAAAAERRVLLRLGWCRTQTQRGGGRRQPRSGGYCCVRIGIGPKRNKAGAPGS
jgi:hypothetical protein